MFTLTPLPYSPEALEPSLSRGTVHYHHEVLQGGYVRRLNGLTRGTHLAQVPLPQLIQGLDPDDPSQEEIWRMASQAWNHEFFWQSMSPQGGGRPRGLLAEALGSYQDFKASFTETALSVFGSGWIWLMASPDGQPHLWPGDAASNPMSHGYLPLLTCDLWEHAYYLDFPADRQRYVQIFLDRLINWGFAEANYDRSFA